MVLNVIYKFDIMTKTLSLFKMNSVTYSGMKGSRHENFHGMLGL